MDTSRWKEIYAQAAEQLSPAYLVEEESHRLLYVNQILAQQLGREPVGELCYQALMGRETPCPSCPARMAPGTRLFWESYQMHSGGLCKLCHVALEVDGIRCRAGTFTDVSDLIDLSCQLSGYLALMKHLSEIQWAMISRRDDPLPLLLEFLLTRFGGQRAWACFQTPDGQATRVDLEPGHPPLYQPCAQLSAPPEGGLSLEISGWRYLFQLDNPAKSDLWQEERDFIFMIVRPYLETTILHRKLEWEGSHDPLTGLGNRMLFTRRVKEAYAALPLVSMIFLDVDGLKRCNDTHGHDMGDRLLRKAAGILQAVAGEQIHPYRMGGDEFVLVCPGLDEASAQALLAGVQARVAQSNLADPQPPLSFSAGCATARSPVQIDCLLTAADQAMYRQKQAKRAAAQVMGEERGV